jgi:putative phosphoesterase
MLLAVFGDVHGNLSALQQALARIDDLGIQTVLCTGDLVAGYPHPCEVIDLVRERRVLSVQGGMDRRVAQFQRQERQMRERLEPDVFEQIRLTHDSIRSEMVEYLRGLPARTRATFEGVGVSLSHGMPAGPAKALDPDADIAVYRRQREFANMPLILTGKTHRPHSAFVDGTLFVNPGSLGQPASGPGTFAVVNTERDPWDATFHEVTV